MICNDGGRHARGRHIDYDHDHHHGYMVPDMVPGARYLLRPVSVHRDGTARTLQLGRLASKLPVDTVLRRLR